MEFLLPREIDLTGIKIPMQHPIILRPHDVLKTELDWVGDQFVATSSLVIGFFVGEVMKNPLKWRAFEAAMRGVVD